jgi:hypothetical protein
MKIIDSYLTGSMLTDVELLTNRYQYMMYEIDPLVVEHLKSLLPKSTVILFSGSWRFSFDATYIELAMFKECLLNFHSSTLFVEPKNIKLYNLTLQSLKPNTIAVLHSDYWIAHQPLDQLLSNLDDLLQYVQPGGQIICTIPFRHINFNRLTTAYEDLGFPIIGESIVIVRK